MKCSIILVDDFVDYIPINRINHGFKLGNDGTIDIKWNWNQISKVHFQFGLENNLTFGNVYIEIPPWVNSRELCVLCQSPFGSNGVLFWYMHLIIPSEMFISTFNHWNLLDNEIEWITKVYISTWEPEFPP